MTIMVPKCAKKVRPLRHLEDLTNLPLTMLDWFKVWDESDFDSICNQSCKFSQ